MYRSLVSTRAKKVGLFPVNSELYLKYIYINIFRRSLARSSLIRNNVGARTTTTHAPIVVERGKPKTSVVVTVIYTLNDRNDTNDDRTQFEPKCTTTITIRLLRFVVGFNFSAVSMFEYLQSRGVCAWTVYFLYDVWPDFVRLIRIDFNSERINETRWPRSCAIARIGFRLFRRNRVNYYVFEHSVPRRINSTEIPLRQSPGKRRQNRSLRVVQAAIVIYSFKLTCM